MRKFASILLLTTLLLQFISCSNNNNDFAISSSQSETTTVTTTETTVATTQNSTALTLDNISDYFDITATIQPGNTEKCYYKAQSDYLYNSLICGISFEGNPHYEYKDVIIEIKFHHTTPLTGAFESEKTVSVKLNLSGNGSATCELETPVAQEAPLSISDTTYAFYSAKGISVALDYSEYKIISVSGTATRY